MKKTLALTITIPVAAIAAPAANAGPVFYPVWIRAAHIDSAVANGGDTAVGGCFFSTNRGPDAVNANETGVIGAVAVTRTAANLPIGATVHCDVEVNGAVVTATYHFRGTTGPGGVPAGASQFGMASSDTDVVSLCEDVTFDDGTATGWFCELATAGQAPPQATIDVAHAVSAAVVDPAVCPLLAGAAGSYGAGAVTVTPSGDVILGYPGSTPVYDCPPYTS